MIPKYIHYCWYGSKELPEQALNCIESWKKFMPDYEIILWDESNSPMDHAYMQKAYQEKKWANLSNYTRLYALKKMGGWYFDTDVEVVKTPNLSRFKETCFLCMESRPGEKPFIVNNAVIATEANHPFIAECFEAIGKEFDGTELANLSSPVLTTNELKKIGFKGKPTVLKSIRVFSNDYFYPSAWFETYNETMATKNTICVHYNDISWFSAEHLSLKDFIDLEKKHAKLKYQYRKIKGGDFSMLELLKLNYRFIKFKISK